MEHKGMQITRLTSPTLTDALRDVIIMILRGLILFRFEDWLTSLGFLRAGRVTPVMSHMT